MTRVLDILFSALALFILTPLLFPIVTVLKFTGEGEIFYLQKRIGKNGRQFNLIKFATMLKNSPNMGTGTVTVKSDPRVLPVGRFLRSSKINELPQLINILLGDMSVIGPRPLTAQSFEAYSEHTQAMIIKVRPGLSGIGSIIFRGEEEIMRDENASIEYYNEVIAPYKGELEEWFILNRNLFVYFKAILVTFCMVVYPRSKLPWRVFRTLPEPPESLRIVLCYD